MTFDNPNSIGVGKWYVGVDTTDGRQYLHLDGEVKPLTDAVYVLFSSRELAQEAVEKYNKVIRIGGE